MPNYENNNLHGYLIITIDIKFPKNDFTEQDKEGNYYRFENLNCIIDFLIPIPFDNMKF